jgi:probable O-glycosylation ligase (exosortase A-associated)
MLRTGLVLVIVALGAGMALRNRFAALLLYVWFAFFRPQEWVSVDLTPLHLSLLIGLLLVVPSLLEGSFPNLSHSVSICALGFIVCALGAQFDAVRRDVGWQWIDYMSRLVLVALLTIRLTNSPQRLFLLTVVIAGSFGFYSSKAGLFSLLGGGLRFADGLAGAFVDNNGYAVGATMVLPLALVVAQNAESRIVRIVAYASLPLTAFAAVSTFSRGGFLALGAGALTWVLLQRRRLVWLALAGTLVSAAIAIAPIPEGYADRLKTIETYNEVGETSALSRLYFWRVALRMTADHPLGIGLRNFEATYDLYDDTDGLYGHNRSVHSSHLQALVEAGIGGGIAYAGVCGCALWAAWVSRRRSSHPALTPHEQRFLWTMSNALIASLVAFLVGGAFIAMALNDLLWFEAALAASLDLVSRRLVAASATAEIVAPAGSDLSISGSGALA